MYKNKPLNRVLLRDILDFVKIDKLNDRKDTIPRRKRSRWISMQIEKENQSRKDMLKETLA